MVAEEEVLNKKMIVTNLEKIRETYNWDLIIDQYATHFREISIKPKQKNVIAAT